MSIANRVNLIWQGLILKRFDLVPLLFQNGPTTSIDVSFYLTVVIFTVCTYQSLNIYMVNLHMHIHLHSIYQIICITVSTDQKIVISCWLGGPRNSWLIRCSRIQTTAPTKRKKEPVTHHICQENGFRNAHGLDFFSFTAATTTSPDSIKGCVKSTIFVLLVTIVMSPTAASNFLIKRK